MLNPSGESKQLVREYSKQSRLGKINLKNFII